MRILRTSLFLTIISSATGMSALPTDATCSLPLSSGEGEGSTIVTEGVEAASSYTICSTRPRRTEIIMADSSVSRKTMKKMGTENKFLAMAEERGRKGGAKAGRTKREILGYKT